MIDLGYTGTWGMDYRVSDCEGMSAVIGEFVQGFFVKVGL